VCSSSCRVLPLRAAPAPALWQMEFAWEYNFQEVARMAESDRTALHSLTKDPFKGSSRDTFLESEDEYAIRKEIEKARARGLEGEQACERDTAAHVASSLPLGSTREAPEEDELGTSSLPHPFRGKDGEGQEAEEGHC